MTVLSAEPPDEPAEQVGPSRCHLTRRINSVGNRETVIQAASGVPCVRAKRILRPGEAWSTSWGRKSMDSRKLWHR